MICWGFATIAGLVAISLLIVACVRNDFEIHVSSRAMVPTNASIEIDFCPSDGGEYRHRALRSCGGFYLKYYLEPGCTQSSAIYASFPEIWALYQSRPYPTFMIYTSAQCGSSCMSYDAYNNCRISAGLIVSFMYVCFALCAMGCILGGVLQLAETSVEYEIVNELHTQTPAET